MFDTIPNIISAIAALVTAIVSLWAFFERKKRKLAEDISEFKIFRKETEFFDSISLEKAKEIKILCHTGKILIRELMVSLEKIDNKPMIDIKVLLKDPFNEHPRRRRSIVRVCNDLMDYCRVRNNLTCEIRFYSSLPAFRGLFIDYINNNRVAYLSLYDWRKENPRRPVKAITSFAEAKGISWRGEKDKQKELIKIIESIFSYYWGEGQIHTIVFDFDDTLLKTSGQHVKAYIEAIDTILDKYDGDTNYLNNELKLFYGDNEETREYLFSLLSQFSDALVILTLIFSESISGSEIEEANKIRQDLRKKYMFENEEIIEQNKFENIEQTIETLNNKNYPLYICSLTAEDDIEKILEVLDLQTYFTGILGREAYQQVASDSIEAKTFMLNKISKLSGVAPDRILFISDHIDDEKAANIVGCKYLEARLLGDVNNNAEENYFTNYNQLIDRLTNLQNKLHQDISRVYN